VGAIAHIPLTTTRDLGKLARPHHVELGLRDARKGDHLLVAHRDRLRPIDHGAHRELRLRRNADLARDDEVEVGVQPTSHLRGHRNAASGQREDHGARALISSESIRQSSAGLAPVAIDHFQRAGPPHR
jgi:hypothetical protein